MQSMPMVSDNQLFMVNTLFISDEFHEEYFSVLEKVLPLARQLEGCVLLEAGRAMDEPNTVVLTEIWKNGNQYLNEYLQLPFYQEYLAASEHMYAAPRQVTVLTRL